jgi:hypothetical protein
MIDKLAGSVAIVFPLVGLVKNILKTVLISLVTGLVLSFYVNALGTLSVLPVQQALNSAGSILVTATLLITGALFLIAVLDMSWQFFQHQKKLRNLALLTARLLQSPLDNLEFTPDTDILALFNPRLSDIPPASDADGV